MAINKTRSIIFFSLAILFLLITIVLIIVDVVTYKETSKLPLYACVIKRIVEFIPLSIISLILGFVFLKIYLNNNGKEA